MKEFLGYKSGFVAVIGRPNVGKSTLLNKITGQKIAICTDKVQTTRKRIKGIHSSDKGQIIFVDTPGVHKPLDKLGEFLLNEAKFSIPDADLVVFLTDISERPGNGDKWIIENLLKANKNVIIAGNKSDLGKSDKENSENAEEYKKLFNIDEITTVILSAKTGANVDELINLILDKLPEGPKYYPDDEVTDQNVRTIAEEIVREKILENTFDEIPHSVVVQIEHWKEEEKLTRIAANIFVERDSQKGIIIGKKASMIKKIGTEARVEIEELLEKKVFLELHVKVSKDWRAKDNQLKNFGYIH
jgi:GTPase